MSNDSPVPRAKKPFKTVTTPQMVEVDRAMIADYHIQLIQMTVFEPAIRAAATITLALPKQGLIKPEVVSNVGELYLADISVPPSLYTQPALNLEIEPIFAQSDIIRLR